jgi:outer membrane protein insertion porin family
MGYFNQESINVNPKPNQADGTVDLEYVVEEASSDQLELSLGFGAASWVLSAGVSFNNFSFKKMFKKNAWTPVPSGDGQRLAFRASTNARYYQYYAASFTEPWVGGKKPNSLSATLSYQVQSKNVSRKSDFYGDLKILGFSLTYGQKLKWPDDYFQIAHTLMYQRYQVTNFYEAGLVFSNGFSNNISYTFTIFRNSVDAPIYPRSGSEIMFSAQFTPPYSLFLSEEKRDFTNKSAQEKYQWLEMHKWKFNISWFTRIVENLVVNVRFKSGFMGQYNKTIGLAPFERFYLGGDGLSNFSYDGREIIGMRGYDDWALTPHSGFSAIGGAIYHKFTAEVRYPITLNPSATIYLLGFAEAGNCWEDKRLYSPFKLYKSAGVGIRVYLPMFGLLGFDWGYGFDEIPYLPNANKSRFHISINSSID